jgi:hypothetical protein
MGPSTAAATAPALCAPYAMRTTCSALRIEPIPWLIADLGTSDRDEKNRALSLRVVLERRTTRVRDTSDPPPLFVEGDMAVATDA